MGRQSVRDSFLVQIAKKVTIEIFRKSGHPFTMKWTISVAAMVAMISLAQAGPPPVTKACVPNASWKDGCNDCICNEQAQPMCTTRDCTATTTPVPHRDCEPGTTWKQGCNNCHCTSSGVGVCTQMACLGDLGGAGGAGEVPRTTPLPGRPKTGAVCREGHSWKEDCNSCICSGGRSACTQMACLKMGTTTDNSASSESSESSDEKVRCSPGSTWRKDCNNCGCVAGRAACTKMACHRPLGGCTPGTSWDKDCNKCRCSPKGEAMCTLMKCVTKRAVPKQPEGCKPGDVWQIDCNTCRCTVSGVPACTKMRCVTKPQEQQ